MSLTLTSEILLKVYEILREFLDLRYMTPADIEPEYSITSFSIKPGSDIGDNYLSAIYDVKFSSLWKKRRQTLSESKIAENFELILKSQLINNSATDTTKYFWNILFTKERLIYAELLQGRFTDLSRENIKFQIAPFAPKMHHFYSEGEDYSCLILDNLHSLGYYIPKCNEGDGINLEEAIMVFKHLARLHALSIVQESKDGIPLPLKYEYLGAEMMFSQALSSVMQPFTQNSYLGVVKLAEKFRPDLVPHLVTLNSTKSAWTRLCELIKPGTTRFSVLCHGDPRPPNIFMKKSSISESGSSGNGHGNGSVHADVEQDVDDLESVESLGDSNSNSSDTQQETLEGLRFIDFQLSRYAAAVTDLHYFLYSGGTSRNFREKNTDELLSIYCREFKLVLSYFPDVSLPPEVINWGLPQLRAEFEAFNLYGFLIGLVFTPLILLKPGDIDKSMDQMTPEERDEFVRDSRKELVLKLGSNYELLRERLFEICDEMKAKNVI